MKNTLIILLVIDIIALLSFTYLYFKMRKLAATHTMNLALKGISFTLVIALGLLSLL